MTQQAGPDPVRGSPGETPVSEPATIDTSIPLTFGPTVTLFFSDIRGFTEYTDEHGDAAAFRMLQYHNTMVQEQIALYGGHIVKTLGDSYMVSFNAARNAMACGIGIQKSLAQYNDNVEGAKIHIGIGINMGEPIRDADDFFGGSVNLAARICAAAGPGEILVSEGVRHVVGKMEGTDYVDRGTFELKGFHEPQHLYEVDWSGLAASRAMAPLAPRVTPTRGSAATAPAPTKPPRSASHRLVTFAGVAGIILAIYGGIFLLRSQGFRPFAGNPAARSETAKPGQSAANTGANAPAAAAGAPGEKAGLLAATAVPAPTSAPAAKPAATGPSPAASAAAAAASPSSAAVQPASVPAATKPSAGGGSPGPATVASPAPAERLLRADDFSDPARGLFPNNQQGSSRLAVESGPTVEYEGSFAYQDGALVGRLVGEHPGADRPAFGRNIAAVDKMFDDFAAEVRGRITLSPRQSRFGIYCSTGPNEAFNVVIYPGIMSWFVTRTVNGSIQTVTSGRTNALKPPEEDNLLRVEVRGDTVRVFANGQEIGRAQHEAIGRRNGTIGLFLNASGALANRTSEVRFDDFKLFSLAP